MNDVNNVCSNDLWWKIYRADPMNMTSIYIFVTKPDSPEKMVLKEDVNKIQNFTAQTWTFLKVSILSSFTCAFFLRKSFFCSFFTYVRKKNLPKRRSFEKFVRKNVDEIDTRRMKMLNGFSSMLEVRAATLMKS